MHFVCQYQTVCVYVLLAHCNNSDIAKRAVACRMRIAEEVMSLSRRDVPIGLSLVVI